MEILASLISSSGGFKDPCQGRSASVQKSMYGLGKDEVKLPSTAAHPDRRPRLPLIAKSESLAKIPLAVTGPRGCSTGKHWHGEALAVVRALAGFTTADHTTGDCESRSIAASQQHSCPPECTQRDCNPQFRGSSRRADDAQFVIRGARRSLDLPWLPDVRARSWRVAPPRSESVRRQQTLFRRSP